MLSPGCDQLFVKFTLLYNKSTYSDAEIEAGTDAAEKEETGSRQGAETETGAGAR